MKHQSWDVNFIAPNPQRAQAISKTKIDALASRVEHTRELQAVTRMLIALLPEVLNHIVRVECKGHIDRRNGRVGARISIVCELDEMTL